MKKSRNNGIHATTSPKVSQKLLERINKEAEEYEDGKAGVIREALTEYFFPNPVEISIPGPEIIEERTYTIQGLVGLDVAHALNSFSHQNNVGIEVVSGSILTDFVNQRWKYKQNAEERIDIVVLPTDLAEIRRLFESEQDSVAYEDFLTDVLRAGILAKKSEKNTGFRIDGLSQETPDNSIKISFDEINDEEVRKSLQESGFNEDRYMTIKKESETRDKFSRLLDEKVEELNRKVRASEAKILQSEAYIESFEKFRLATLAVIKSYAEYSSSSIFSKLKRFTEQEIVSKYFDQKFL
ncbi:hypothetical protein SAMN04515674_101454 [Pseudarcicella hirudinis]|uniref:Uncharacterized protein n=1 Tax=Pseudarcicella hirudinis TaxID=1079859 RepID=A0A1I5MV57_9BACT|nr:hypothetical protein [Pseudarcicella hirudinis]SFP13207.1 hypothetical protein SAMN04515674_101454 [Pseudarcicella hirudinis]